MELLTACVYIRSLQLPGQSFEGSPGFTSTFGYRQIFRASNVVLQRVFEENILSSSV